MYRYFIVFNFFLEDGRTGIANMETTLTKEITCFNDIKEVEKSILDDNKTYRNVVISNYIEFSNYNYY